MTWGPFGFANALLLVFALVKAQVYKILLPKEHAKHRESGRMPSRKNLHSEANPREVLVMFSSPT